MIDPHQAVHKEIKAGRLKPITECICVDCGRPAEHYDHRDYNRPIDVDPVCAVCNARRGSAVEYSSEVAAFLETGIMQPSAACEVCAGIRDKHAARMKRYRAKKNSLT